MIEIVLIKNYNVCFYFFEYSGRFGLGNHEMFRKMHRFHRWDFGTENHVLLYPKNTLPENRQILNCPVMGSMQLTQFFTTF